MKRNVLAAVGLILALIGAALAWQQRERALRLEEKVAALTEEVRQKDFDAIEQRKLADRLKSENDGYTNEASVLREKLAQQIEPSAPASATEPETAASPTPSIKGKMGDLISGMMKDPKMKAMMRQQQTVMLKQMYADFVKERHLSPQQADQFFDLLLQKQSGEMEEGLRAMNGDAKDGAVTDSAKQSTADARAEADRQLQMILGNGGYSAYQDYEKTTGERMSLNQMRQQLALNNIPLADEQAKTLLQVMVDEDSKSPPSPLASRHGNSREQMRALSDPSAEQFYQRQADLNQRVLNRAASILKPEQFNALEAYQQQQLEMQKLGMEMARKMMGDEEDGSTHTTIITPGPVP